MSVTTAQHRRTGRLAGPAATLGAAVGAMSLLAVVDPNEPGHYPACPFLSVTGLYCPGCGSLRALHALGQGRIGEAAGLNVLTTLAVPLLAVMWLGWVVRQWRGALRGAPADPRLLAALPVVVVVFWVVRNLPIGAALAP